MDADVTTTPASIAMLSGSAQDAVPDMPSAAFPVTFSDTVGLYAPAGGTTRQGGIAVLFVSPWGYEELCARKFWRILAEELAAAGIASMRFDYPGTGDALEPEDFSAGLDLWQDSVTAAVRTLRDISGASRILLVGQGLGAALAWRAAHDIDGIAGLALLAPVLSGRLWLREVVAWTRITNPETADGNSRDTSPAMGEQTIPAAVLAGIRTLDITSPSSVPVQECLVLARDGRPADAAFATHLGTLGAQVETAPFEGYDRFVSDIMISIPPRGAIDRLVGWASRIATETADPAERQAATAALPAHLPPEALPLRGDGFTETPLRFGGNDRLYGILAEPAGARRGATVIIMSTGYDRMSGRGRIAVNVARNLARAGIPSLRFDIANVADSPPLPGAPQQVAYSEFQYRDVDEAMAFLAKHALFPVIISGRCSGAYAAFHSAVRDSRFSAAVPVNIYDFRMDGCNIDELIHSSPQPLSSYRSKLMKADFWRRVLSGEVRIENGFSNLSRMFLQFGSSLATPLLAQFPVLSARFRAVNSDFQAIAANGTQLSLLYSEGDIGLGSVAACFGANGDGLDRYGNVRFTIIAGADHNLTTSKARDTWCNELSAMALRFPPESAANLADVQKAEYQLS